MKVYYWSPFISHVATVTAVINSIISLKKFFTKNDYKIINVFKEWSLHENELKKNQIECIDLRSLLNINFLPKLGFLKSRFTYILTYFFSILKLHNLLKKEKPDILIIHLISSIPLSLLLLFNYETKFILRISGLPRFNFLRKFLWKRISKKISLVTCPSLEATDYIKQTKIFDENKIVILYDPIINNSLIFKKK